jgi:hypothetical protein
MRTLLILILFRAAAALQIRDMRTEYLREPVGLDTPAPRFSWQVASDAASRGLAQKAFRIDGEYYVPE